MIRVGAHPRFWREIDRAPEEVKAWAAKWVKAAQAPGAAFSEMTQDASPMKGRNARDHYVHKWRKKKPHGEYRLVFRAAEEEVFFVWLGPRGDDYKTALRRIRAMS